MARRSITCRLLWLVLAISGFLGVTKPVVAAPTGELLLHDPLNRIKKNIQGEYTVAQVLHGNAVAAGHPGATGAVLSGAAQIVRSGHQQALQLRGTTCAYYFATGNIDLGGGVMTFRVALNFNPNVSNQATRNQLRNQNFICLIDDRGNRCYVYTCLNNICVCIRNPKGNIIFYCAGKVHWKPNQFHQVQVRWGKRVEIWSAGQRIATSPWPGLFGPLAVDVDSMRLYIGEPPHYIDIVNQFTIADLKIYGSSARQSSTRPLLAVPYIHAAPAFDGTLAGPFWRQAARTTGFSLFNTNELAHPQPVIYAAYNAKALYIGLDAKLSDKQLPQATITTQNNPGVCREDALEIYLQPAGMAADERDQLVFNAIGTTYNVQFRGTHVHTGYSSRWQVKTASRPGGWTAEVRIPFAAVGASPPKAGAIWRGNFCLDSANGFSSADTWSPAQGAFNNPANFGELLFTGSARTIREPTFTGFRAGQPKITLTLEGGFSPVITVHASIFNADGEPVFKHDVLMHDSKSMQISPGVLSTGRYAMSINAIDEHGKEVFRQLFRFRTNTPLDLTVRNYPDNQVATVDVDASGTHQAFDHIACILSSPAGRPLQTLTLGAHGKAVVNGVLHTRSLKPGIYQVKADVIAASGKALESTSEPLRLYPKPQWWHNTLGQGHWVPPPWSPVRVKADSVDVWGRQQLFDGGALPAQIVNQGRPMFTSAPTLELVSAGHTVNIARLPHGPWKNTSDAATAVATASAGDVRVRCRSRVAFDGCMRYDLTLTPTGRSASIDRLDLTLPLRRPIGRYILSSNDQSSSSVIKLAHSFASPFLPYIWIGNDNRGVCWFTNSDQFFHPRDDGRIIQAVVDGQKSVLTVHFISSPLNIHKPITITFGLMASPVRPTPHQPFAYRQEQVASPGEKITFGEWLRYPHLRLSPEGGTIEFWMRRTKAHPFANTGLFSLGGAKHTLQALLLTPNNPSTLELIYDHHVVMKGKLPTTTGFMPLALVWANGTMRLYAGGQLIGHGPTQPLQALLAGDHGRCRLQIGCSGWSDTGLVVDEVRVSDVARYNGSTYAVPTDPFSEDGHTVLLDHLNDHFRPDGQDARTAAGGIPTFGARFVKGKFGGGLRLQVAPSVLGLKLFQKYGIHITTLWNWLDQGYQAGGPGGAFFGRTRVGIRKENVAYKADGIRPIPYFAYPAILSPSPLAAQFGAEWEAEPLSSIPWKPGRLVTATAAMRSYRDYYTAGVAWVMKQLGYDGYYTDGFALVYPSENIEGGCGYVDRQGHRHKTWPIFRTRALMERMYRAAKKIDPHCVIVNHVSFNVLLPTLSFSDVRYTGEHEDYEDLLTCRLRFDSKPWGIYTTLLGADAHAYSPLCEMTGLLLGTGVWGMTFNGRRDMFRKEQNVIDAYRTFGFKTATFYRWFKAVPKYVQTGGSLLKAALYVHPGRDVLLIAANYNHHPVEATLALQTAALRLAGRHLSAVNALTGQAVPVDAKGTLRVPLSKLSFTVIWIQAR